MKKFQHYLLRQFNFCLSALIAFLGIGCRSQKKLVNTDTDTMPLRPIEHEIIMCKYGVPSATHIVQGSILPPKQGVQVLISTTPYQTDTLLTDAQGKVEGKYRSFPTDSVTVTVIDPAQPADSVSTRMPVVEHDQGDGWNSTDHIHFEITLPQNKE